MKGKSIPESFGYLKESPGDLSGTIDFLDHNIQITIAKSYALKLLQHVASQMQENMASGKNILEIQNDYMTELLECARAHTHIIMLQYFVTTIYSTTDHNIKAILSQLCSLFVLQHMDTYTTARMLELGILQVEHTRTIRTKVLGLCKKLRPEAIGLVDAFNHPDCVITSPLGRYDGNIYQHYFNAVKSSRGAQEVPDYWLKLVQPRLRKDGL